MSADIVVKTIWKQLTYAKQTTFLLLEALHRMSKPPIAPNSLTITDTAWPCRLNLGGSS